MGDCHRSEARVFPLGGAVFLPLSKVEGKVRRASEESLLTQVTCFAEFMQRRMKRRSKRSRRKQMSRPCLEKLSFLNPQLLAFQTPTTPKICLDQSSPPPSQPHAEIKVPDFLAVPLDAQPSLQRRGSWA